MLQFWTSGYVFGGKTNIGGTLERSQVKIPKSFQMPREKQTKNEEKTVLFVQNPFSTKSIFLLSRYSKTKNCRYFKLSPNFYIEIIYTWYNFWKLLTFFELFIDNWNFQLFFVFFSEMWIKKIWLDKNSWKFNTRYLICRTYRYKKKFKA